jgi:integration host factor subunit beta
MQCGRQIISSPAGKINANHIALNALTRNEKPHMEEKSARTTITKKDVSKRTARIIGEKTYLTEKVVDGVFQALREFMSEASPEVRIEIRDFGVLEVKKTKAKPKARNPKTGEVIFVPARRKTHFRAGKLLKEVLKTPLDEL